jgi:glycosyltransferase involved in cell wall biosynthesis
MASELFSLSAFDKRYNIAVWLWELENIPNEWYWVFPYLNEIWTPSQFIRDAIRKISPIPVTLIPYGIETPVDERCSRAFFEFPKDAFIVLCMFDSNSFASRKNPLGALEAFTKAFGRNHPRAIMVLKINNPKEEDLQKIKADVGDCKNIIFFTKTLEKAQANALINCCDVLISLHRSEGFGLVMAEAMSLGRAVIATNWSANTEFMNEKVACMVDYEFIFTNGEYQFDNAEQRWADANVDQAANYLLRLYEDPLYYEQVSNAGQAYIKEHFSLEKSAMAMEKRVWEILQANASGD